MSDDPSLTDVTRRAVRGKVPERREDDTLRLRDWLGYVLAVLLPICGALLIVWQQSAVMEKQIERLEQDLVKMELAHAALWRAINQSR